MANVKLSVSEIELMTNAAIILTKNNILQQVQQLFGKLATTYQSTIQKQLILPQKIAAISPKIAKGENYEGLPWVMLDYPRYFNKEDIFAIRTFFWWGNFCSISLLLKGEFLETGKGLKLKGEGSGLHNNDWFLCCNESSPWEHHFRSDNYLPLNDFTDENIAAMPFIKLSKKIPLNKWDDIENFMQVAFEELLFSISFLNDETIL